MEIAFYVELVKKLNIKENDIILVSSDMRKLMINHMRRNETFDLQIFLEALTIVVGKNGTVLIPTYNWDFCKGKTFDYYRTPCKTGALGSAALKNKKFKRSKHPIYSFAIWGKDQDMLCSFDYSSSFGEDSVFAYLYKNKAKNLVIDIDVAHCFTFAHYVEETSGMVNYRYLKKFSAEYIDDQGKCEKKSYEMFVRNLDLEVTNVGPSENNLLDEGIGTVYEIDGSHFFVFGFEEAFYFILNDIRENASRKICRYNGQDN